MSMCLFIPCGGRQGNGHDQTDNIDVSSLRMTLWYRPVAAIGEYSTERLLDIRNVVEGVLMNDAGDVRAEQESGHLNRHRGR